MNEVIINMQKKNQDLSKYACLDKEAKRINLEEEDFRTPFYRDIDRIIYTLSYIRYIDKTQVFSFQTNDHLSKRMIHVQYVSKIARTIGRALNLNEDLIEAASLGHDLGHVPFGHVGEKILNEISLEYNEGYFKHNIQSVRLLMNIENYGKGNNLNYQVLDAIMCHNGEFIQNKYIPKAKTINEFLREYNQAYHENNLMIPSTLEGCVVRISDLIGYLGRDIEDGLRLGLIKKSDVPENIQKTLGINNRDIVNTIVSDIIKNSLNQNYILISPEIFQAMNDLKAFNYQYIYHKAYTETELTSIKKMFYLIFKSLLNDLKAKNEDSCIYHSYYQKMSKEYQDIRRERIVIDYIAGMTDNYFKKTYEKINKF